nr:low temperature requirement protein A [Deinococcus radiodurans]
MTGGPEGKPDNIALQQQTVGNHAPRGDQLTGTPASEEQKVSWLELFFDLIFVVAFDQLAKRLGANASLANIGIFLLLFTAVWWAWASNSTFAARYGNERRVYRWDTVAELISVALLAVIIRGDLEQTGTYFAVAFGINRLLNAGLHRWADHKTPADVTFSRRTSAVVGTAGLLWLGSALLPSGSGAQLAVWGPRCCSTCSTRCSGAATVSRCCRIKATSRSGWACCKSSRWGKSSPRS